MKKNFFKSNINLVMICAGALGCLIIICLFFYEDIFTTSNSINSNDKPQKLFFNYHPTYLLSLANAILQGVIWWILIFPATVIISSVRNEFKERPRVWPTLLVLLIALAIVLIALGSTIFQYVTPPMSAFNHNDVKDAIFIGLAISTGFCFLFGIVMIGKLCIRKIESGTYDVTEYKRLRSYQDSLLSFTGIILSLGVISSILYRKAFIEAGGASYEYPEEFVVMFGFINTLLMLIFYLPNYFIIDNYGKRIVAFKYPLEDEKKELVTTNFEQQEILSKNLKLDMTFIESVKKIGIILSPILSSFLAQLFDLFK